MSKVVLKKCASYRPDEIDAAIASSFALLGGVEKFVKKGDSVLLKVNALFGAKPEAAVTTHPELLRAVIKAVRPLASKIYVGDSPGFGSFTNNAKICGFAKVAAEEGAEIAEFAEEEEIECLNPLNYKKFKVSSIINSVDKIINLPKFKTHALMFMTLAVKNMFGIIPGFSKAGYHMRSGQDRMLFARILVDLFRAKTPALNILDGIEAMEGNGPGGGTVYKLGLVMMSDDGFAMDFAAARIAGFRPEMVFTNLIYKNEILKGEEPEIEILGEKIESATVKDFQPVDRLGAFTPNLFKNMLYGILNPKQIYLKTKCTGCLRCVKHCPVNVLVYDAGKKITCDYKKCIKCFICQEICPEKAIVMKESFLAPLFGRAGKAKK